MAKGKHGQQANETRHEARGEHEAAQQAAKQDQKNIKELFAEIKAADQFYVADFKALSGSGVDGFALLTADFGRPNDPTDDLLTVRIAATGLDEGVHLQHIHGFENGTEAVTPTQADDTDEDGFIELAEGAPAYGPVLLNLRPFPAISQDDGSFVFKQTFHLPSGDADHNNEAHSGDVITTFNKLDLNHLVIHGREVPLTEGLGTPGEVGEADPDSYKELLPVAVAEIEQVSRGQAHQMLKQAYSDGFDLIA